MANPNPEIYRTPEHWVNCKILSGTADGVNRPKIIDWCGDNRRRTGTIGAVGAVPNGFLQASQPLDLSICPTGQHPSVSCFSEILRFQNPRTNEGAPIPTEIIERKNAPCNWIFGEVDATWLSSFGPVRDKSNPLQRWSPNSANNDNANTNWFISPYATWGIRGALLKIQVVTVTSYDTYSGVQLPHYDSGNTMSLDDWKNSHSDRSIMGIDFVFYGNQVDNGTTISYADNWIYNDGTGVSACSIDQCGEYAGAPFYDYTRGFYNYGKTFALLPGINEPFNNTASSLYFYGVDKFQGAEVRGVSNPSDGWKVYVVVPFSQENYDAILKMAACFAMAFTPKSKYTFTLTDDDYYLPIIRDNGVSYGEYTHGADNMENPVAQITNIRNINYNPYGYNIYSGDNQVKKIYFGDTEINAAYIGDQKL